MKATEFRIGNWVQDHYPNTFQIENGRQLDGGDELFGIPLTEEWLLKFGFVEENYSYVKGVHQQVFSGLMKFDFNERLNNWEFSIGNYNDLTRILYVHQLQNLYFALTSEELIIKDNEKDSNKKAE